LCEARPPTVIGGRYRVSDKWPRSHPSQVAPFLRVLEGRFVLARVTDVRAAAVEADLLALVLGPDGVR